jgi:hypothetical protein
MSTTQPTHRPDLSSTNSITPGRRNMRCLATLLSHSPDARMLTGLTLLRGDASPLGMAHAALGEAAGRTDEAATAREYFDLLAGLGQGTLLPYASHYLTGTLYGRPLARQHFMLASARSGGFLPTSKPRPSRFQARRGASEIGSSTSQRQSSPFVIQCLSNQTSRNAYRSVTKNPERSDAPPHRRLFRGRDYGHRGRRSAGQFRAAIVCSCIHRARRAHLAERPPKTRQTRLTRRMPPRGHLLHPRQGRYQRPSRSLRRRSCRAIQR